MGNKGVTIPITGDAESARKALEMVQEHLRRTANEAKTDSASIAAAMDVVKTSLAGIGITVGLTAAIAAMKTMISTSLDLGQTLENASRQTGLAVETLSTLHYAAAVTGTEFDTLTSAVSKMDKSIGAATQGDTKAEAFMRSLGLNAKDLAGRTDGAEIAFKKFTQTLASTEDPIRRVELATGLLGKAGAAQIPMLIQIGQNWDQFVEHTKAAGVYLDGDGAKALEETNQRFKDMQQHIMGASVGITEGMTPGLNQMFSVITGGKSQMEGMVQFGQTLTRVLALAADTAYSTGAALEAVFSLAAGGRLTAIGRKDADAAVRMAKDAQKFFEIAQHAYDKQPTPPPLFTPPPPGRSGEGFGGVGDLTKEKSQEPLLRAEATLEEAYAKQRASMQKEADESELASREALHKLLLLSDVDFYKQQLALQEDDIDGQEQALRDQIATEQATQAKQHALKNVTRDASGRTAEELKSLTRIVELNTQLQALEEKRARFKTASNLGAQERAQEVQLATAKMAAELEEQTNTTITARLALMRLENQLELENIRNSAGSDSPEYRQAQDLEKVKEAMLQIADVDRQIRASEAENKRAVDELNDAAEKDPRLKRAAAQQISELNRQEAAQLQDLVAQYDALAQQLGGPFLETARNLHAELDKLNRPDRKQDAEFTKTLTEGVEGMANSMAEATTRGRDSFRKMAQGIESDMLKLAIKLAEQRWLTPFLNGLGSGGLGGGSLGAAEASTYSTPALDSALGLAGFAEGGDPTGPSIVGEKGPELFFPKGPGTVTPNAVLSKISEGGGRAPSVTMNVTNASSQPVTARTTGTSYDSEMKQFIVHTVLEDHASGGPIAQSLAGLSG